MVDDCHATGFIGPQGRGTPARAGLTVDILTGTLGKALGGSAGGYIAASKPIVDLMRQRRMAPTENFRRTVFEVLERTKAPLGARQGEVANMLSGTLADAFKVDGGIVKTR